MPSDRSHRPRPLPLLASAATLAALAGCNVGPDYDPPKFETPTSFHGAARDQSTPSKVVNAPVDLAKWWTTLQDPTLDSLVDRAVVSNLDVKIAASRVRESRALRGVADAAGVPTVDAKGNYTRSRNSEKTFGSNFPGSSSQKESGIDLFQVGFDASWEIDVFGGVRRSVEAADAEIGVAEESGRDVLVTLLSEVARNYVESRTFQRRIALAERNIGLQVETLGLTNARYNAGLTSELDVAQATAQLETRRSQVPPLRTGFAQATHRLSVLLALEPGALSAELASTQPIPPVPPEIPVGVPSDLLRRRSDIRRAERQLAASTARIGVATADLFPKFSLTGSFGFQSKDAPDLFDLNSRYWSIGPSIRWPAFDAGRIRANIRVENARQEQAALSYTKAVLTSLEDVENSLTSYIEEQNRRKFLTDAVAANQRAYELANQLYTSGLRDFLNVLESQRQLYESEDQLAQSDRGVTASLIALYKALGGGWESFETAQR